LSFSTANFIPSPPKVVLPFDNDIDKDRCANQRCNDPDRQFKGTIVSALCSSVSNLIIYLASNAEGMKTVAFWSMGSLASASWNKLGFIVVLVSLITLFFLTQYRVLNTLLLGDKNRKQDPRCPNKPDDIDVCV